MPRPKLLQRYTLNQPTPDRHKCRERKDVSKFSRKQQAEFARLAAVAQEWLQRKLNDPQFSHAELQELGDAMKRAEHRAFDLLLQARNYAICYPTQPLANAFAPILQKQKTGRAQPHVSEDGRPRRRPPLLSLSDEQRARIIEYTSDLLELIELQSKPFLPPHNFVAELALRHKCSEKTIRNDARHLEHYQSAYPDAPPAEAFVPLPKGRIPGRTIPKEIIEDFRSARLNSEWLSLNRDEKTYQPIHQHLDKKQIDMMIRQLRPDYDKSISTSYRILQAIDQENRIFIDVAKNGPGALQRHAPYRDNHPDGPGIRMQLDIRPLPVVVEYGGIRCTVHYVALVDHFSRYRPVWMLLPAKRVDDDGEIHGQEFKARQIRQLIALYCIKTESRMHILYPDNGVQWSQNTLQPYLPLLTAPGEQPTQLVSRRRGRPRGGGKIERELQLIDRFLRYRPAYIHEDDYRRSRAEIEKKGSKVKIPTFEELVKDFEVYHNAWNTESTDDKPSFQSVWKEGFNKSLTMPSLANLAVFALASERKDNVATDPGGFRIGSKGKQYEPYHFTDEMYKELTNASLNKHKLSVMVFKFDALVNDMEPLVFFSLDKERWHLAIDKAQKGKIEGKWKDMLIRLEKEVERENRSIAEYFQHKLLTAQNGPLVIDAFGREAKVVSVPKSETATAPASETPLVDQQILEESKKVKIGNTSLEAAGLLHTNTREKKPAKKKGKPGQESGRPSMQPSNLNTPPTFSADELAQLAEAEAELERLLEKGQNKV